MKTRVPADGFLQVAGTRDGDAGLRSQRRAGDGVSDARAGRFFEFEALRHGARGRRSSWSMDICSCSAWTRWTRRAGTTADVGPRLADRAAHAVRGVSVARGGAADGSAANDAAELVALGCSFGGYHAVNLALRHPEAFRCFLSMSGIYRHDALSARNYYDQDCYFHAPTHYISNMHDGCISWTACAGATRMCWRQAAHDICLGANEHMSAVLAARASGIPSWIFGVTGRCTTGRWWQQMMRTYM